jgi:hypothetical protein
MCRRATARTGVLIERCGECGFNGGDWRDTDVLAAIAGLPTAWSEALAGLSDEQLLRRPLPGMWSIAEYADHVREVLFGMRFVLDSAVGQPGIVLGDPPAPVFSPTARLIDVPRALAGIRGEADALGGRLAELPACSWKATAAIAGDEVDAHWICRHALHDAMHHLRDVARLRDRLPSGGRVDG